MMRINTGRSTKIYALLIVIVVIFITFAVISQVEWNENINLNSEELLTIEQIEQLLASHDVKIEKVDIAPFDTSSFTMFEKDPTVYQIDGYYALMYQFDKYYSGKDIMINSFKNDYCENEEFVQGGLSAGKNIAVVWMLNIKEIVHARESGEYETYETHVHNVKNILFSNAFNGEKSLYEGENKNWEIVIPVNYYENTDPTNWNLGNDKYVSGKPFFRYKHGDIDTAGICDISIGQTRWKQEINDPECEIFDSKNNRGFVELSDLALSSSVNLNDDITITITYDGGIDTVILSNSRPYDYL